jgi:hypothetical protein
MIASQMFLNMLNVYLTDFGWRVVIYCYKITGTARQITKDTVNYVYLCIATAGHAEKDSELC